MDVDAIVNAANEQLLAGGGVCGAIFRAAGATQLQQACGRVAPCPTGQARITPGFDLTARHIIHAVGPVWRGGHSGEAELLAGAYRSSLEVARDENLVSVAFPAISTGIYGYPLAEAATVATRAVVDLLRKQAGSLGRVLFVLREPETQQLYDQALATL
ncbi:MAG: macro domain-containing protein [Chloroflexota bacterium]|nr:macro domain-containing protein [Chloroflexota bacterium]